MQDLLKYLFGIAVGVFIALGVVIVNAQEELFVNIEEEIDTPIKYVDPKKTKTATLKNLEENKGKEYDLISRINNRIDKLHK